MAYEDALYTRTSHCSYELRNNQLRVFPNPSSYNIEKMWFEFTVPGNNWESPADEGDIGIDGINNMNTLPINCNQTHLPGHNVLPAHMCDTGQKLGERRQANTAIMY